MMMARRDNMTLVAMTLLPLLALLASSAVIQGNSIPVENDGSSTKLDSAESVVKALTTEAEIARLPQLPADIDMVPVELPREINLVVEGLLDDAEGLKHDDTDVNAVAAEHQNMTSETFTSPSGWVGFNGYCYKFENRPLTWDDAEYDC